jgi:opacity protein-like surface antigen
LAALPGDGPGPVIPDPAAGYDLPPPLPRLPEGPDRRTYLAGILGADFGTLEVGQGPNASAPLFTAGGAAGMAFERETGWFRSEFEARYRDPVAKTFSGPVLGEVSVSASDGWSTMVNGWRDFEITDRVGAYLGGGIGGAGYRVVFDGDYAALGATMSGNTRLFGFAWQAGTGATWLVNDRLALDLGYRFFAVDGGNARIVVDAPPISFSDAVGTRYSASELLFTVRIFEPFRRKRD